MNSLSSQCYGVARLALAMPALLVGGLFFGVSTLPAQNLLTNGNFEASTFASSGKTLRTYQEFGQTVTSWYVMSDLSNGVTGWTYAAGNASDELHLFQTSVNNTGFVSLGNSSSDAGGCFSQNFTAVVGATYTASLDVALYGLGPVNGPAIRFGIYNGATLVSSATFEAGNGTLTNNFVTHSISFVAPAANLTFKVWDVTTAGSGGNWGVVFDNASVTGATIPTNGLMLFYPFNGNTNDAGPLQNHGGVVMTGQYTLDRNGVANAAYHITDAYVVSRANIGVTGNADRTVSLWFYLDAQPTAPGGNLCSWGTTSGVGNLFSVVYEPWQEQGYKFGLNCGYLKRGFLAGSNPATGRWHHLICTYTTRLGLARMYLDGTELVGVTDPRWGDANSTINTRDSSVYVGSLITEWWGIRGSIDDVRIYNRALSATEAAALYSAESVYAPDYVTQIAALQQQLAATDDLVASLQGQLATANNSISQLRGDKTVLEQQIVGLNAQLTEKNAQIFQLRNEKDAIQAQLNTASTQLTQLTADKAAIQLDLDSKRTQLATANATVTQLQTDKAGLLQQLSATNALLATANAQNSQLQADKVALQSQLTSVTTQLTAANALVAQLQTANASIQTQLSAANVRIAALSTQVAQLTAANSVLVTQQAQGLSGLDEILRLLRLPVGRRTSTVHFTGPEGLKVNTIIDALLAPPGQTQTTDDYKSKSDSEKSGSPSSRRDG